MKPWILNLTLLLTFPGLTAAEQRNEAASAFARGQALHAKGDYATAIAAFERAYQLKPHHAVLCSIAACNEQMNRFVEAAAYYRRCLSEGAERSAKARSVQQALKVVEAKVNYLEVKSPGAGGVVFVDGVSHGPAPQRVPLNPGQHAVEVRRAGAVSATASVRVVSGEERSLSLVPVIATSELKLPPAAPPEPRAPVVERSRRRLSSGWFWTSVGLTAVLGGAAAVMGGLTYSTASEYERTPTKEGYDTFINRRLATNVLAGLALAAAGSGTALFFFTDFSRRRRSDEVAAGVGLSGSF